ncbi:MAG: glycosyltransferase family 39 protein [Rhodospirillaceae bacterium]|nr:glycosyltransferase family 39 protein [Rhodospirillaceae bacterium]
MLKATDMSADTNRSIWLTAFLWLAVVVVALAVRPALPVDETRYLAVAWDMWRERHYLVPHLNGETYSHKPPLLFWLMTAGWHVFGVNDWWPRLVAPLFGLGSLMLTLRLAERLWPDKAKIAEMAPVLLFGALFWTLFSTLTMFDMMLAFFTLAALLGLMAARDGGYRGFVIAGIAMGFGVLAKGPAIFLHVLPVALSAPWWLPGIVKSRWYAGTALAVLITVAFALVWAVPAGIAGGEAYRDAIFWGQSAGRIVKSFAHARPFWWYAAVLPGLVLPWLIWPPLWRAARRFGQITPDGGVRMCLVWFGTAFVAFSLISGKQLHYLLPEFPALALLAARLLAHDDDTDQAPSRWDLWLPGGVAMLAGGVLMVARYLPLSGRSADLVAESQSVWGVLLLAAGAMAVMSRGRTRTEQMARLAAISAFAVLALHLMAAPILAKRYDLAPLARFLAAAQANGKEIAYFGKYHGQFHFLGRMSRPVTTIGLKKDDEAEFLKAHPGGLVASRYRTLPTNAVPLFTHVYRNYTYAVWSAAAMIAHPGLGERR